MFHMKCFINFGVDVSYYFVCFWRLCGKMSSKLLSNRYRNSSQSIDPFITVSLGGLGIVMSLELGAHENGRRKKTKLQKTD